MFRPGQYWSFLSPFLPFPLQMTTALWFFYHQSFIYWLEVHAMSQDLPWKMKFMRFFSAFSQKQLSVYANDFFLSTSTPFFVPPLIGSGNVWPGQETGRIAYAEWRVSFHKSVSDLDTGSFILSEKSVYLFLPSFSIAIKGYGSQLFMCLLRAREELIGLIYTSSRRLRAAVQKNFLTLNFLENKVCHPHSQIFFFF